MHKRILVIYTGGTIGMVDGGSGNHKPLKLERLEEFLPETNILPVELHYKQHTSIKDSSDHGPEDWVRITEFIYLNFKDFDGFVVIHGTDTMCYTAAAIEKMLVPVNKPVILTGAQRPFGSYLSDAKENLLGAIGACYTCIQEDHPLIGLYFHGKLLPASTSFKKHRTQFDAFDTTDGNLLGKTEDVFQLIQPISRKKKSNETRFIPIQKKSIVWLSAQICGSNEVLLEAALSSNPDAIVLEGYGTGNFPLSEELISQLSSFISKGNIVLVTSENPYGSTNLVQYNNGNKLLDIGVKESLALSKAGVYLSLF